ncbi:hypothetical protein KR222_002673 [Zaprionus bogoriensis]|nr:hypothetical protein KR222_002673 [Zaprionus bogoriensis]
MPIAVFKSVREVSSEDALHAAANLLKENAGKKWKTQSPGEKSAHVILEFEEPQQIVGVDVGNEHAAFIEVLVSKSGCQPDDFKELLLSSSFMTPIESKNSSNVNRVRCFSSDALNAEVLPDKWKLVKIVCTQPFNKHVQYGLSFIKLHVVAAAKPKPLVPERFMLGQLKLREESPDSEPDAKGCSALFQRWKATRLEPEKPAVSTAAAIRDAGSPAALRRLSEGRPAAIKVTPSAAAKRTHSTPPPPAAPAASSKKPQSEAKPLDRNRDALLFGDDDPDEAPAAAAGDAKKQRLSMHLEADKSRRRLELEKLEQDKKQAKSKRQSIEKTTPAAAPKESPKQSPKPAPVLSQKRKSLSQDECKSPAKRPKPEAKLKQIRYVPFNQLLRGVVLVISGIQASSERSSIEASKTYLPLSVFPQNPDRADLRAKAIALGAKYKADWEAGCTHLICAFRNTPKYNQVKGKGKIVTRSWIEKCYALKKYLPWRRYALETSQLDQPESDEELYDESLKPTVDDDMDKDVEFVPAPGADEVLDVDELDEKNFEQSGQREEASDPDTEDELERVAQSN